MSWGERELHSGQVASPISHFIQRQLNIADRPNIHVAEPWQEGEVPRQEHGSCEEKLNLKNLVNEGGDLCCEKNPANKLCEIDCRGDWWSVGPIVSNHQGLHVAPWTDKLQQMVRLTK